jgi:O-antigen ligase
MVQLATAFIILQAMSALTVVDIALYGEWSAKGGDNFTVLSSLLTIVTSFFLLYAGWRKRGAPTLRECFPLAAVVLLFLSACWSAEPADTVRRTVNYAVMVIAALGIAQALTPLQIMRTTAWVCAGAALVSLAIYPTSLGATPSPYGGMDFRGVFPQKNLLGQAMVAGLLAAIYCALAARRTRGRYVMLAVFFLGMAAASKSGTSLGVDMISLAVLSILLLYTRGGLARLASVFFLTCASLGVVFTAVAPDIAFAMLGKDATLTGRTDIWPFVLQGIAVKPWLGWGFNGFWQPSNPAAVSISMALGWWVPEAHNGLLDLLLQVGYIGTALFLLLMIRDFWMSAECMKRGDKNLGRIMLLSISEAVLMTPNQISTLQFFLFDFLCSADLISASARADEPPHFLLPP